MTTYSPQQLESEVKKLWIIFRRFSSQVIEHHPADTRNCISKKFSVKNPKRNLILVQEVIKGQNES